MTAEALGLTLDDIERSGVLPAETVFYSSQLATSALDRSVRAQARATWFEQSLGR
jgi:hypothetical protein